MKPKGNIIVLMAVMTLIIMKKQKNIKRYKNLIEKISKNL